MKQTIEIEVPEGKKAVWKNNKVVFEDVTPKLPKTWEEFCDLYTIKSTEEYYIDGDSSIRAYSPGYNSDLRSVRTYGMDCNLLPSKGAAEAHLALMQLHQLRDYYRQGWKPKSEEETYRIIKRTDNTYAINWGYKRNAFLSFQTNELAQEFFENFEDLIKKADDLI